MDVDLHGPDIPRMLGLKGLLEVSANKRMVPMAYSDNLEVVSIECMTKDKDRAVIWRGPLWISPSWAGFQWTPKWCSLLMQENPIWKNFRIQK
ncbi:MAG: P-loop NTPase [Deltaproteobacteria bacterium]|nr:P-loop NTPase [Deltaproteobacteria bacterium]